MSWFEHGSSRIYFEESGGGDPVLLLPGLTDSIDQHKHLRNALLASGYRIIAADLPGSGRSLPQPRQYTVSYFDDDARAFAALLHHLRVESVHWIGFSDGGEVALLAAELFPDATRSVATWGAAGVLNDPTGQLREALYHVIDQPIPPLQDYSRYLIATYGEDNARTTTRNAANAFSNIIVQRGGDISLSKADTIACPVLLITGEHDMFAPPTVVAALTARIPNAEMLEVKDVGHDVHNMRPDWLAQTILGWLKQH